MFVKACGITDFTHIDWACELGYSAVGFVVYEKSARFVSEEKLEKMLAYAKGKIKTVVVSINFDDVTAYLSKSDFVQIYEYVRCRNLIFASDKKPISGYEFEYFMYDSSRGKGLFESDFPDWLYQWRDRLIYSGGLTSDNVGFVINKLSPFGVDVSSGIEDAPGKKSYNKMAEFIIACKEALNE